MSRVSTHQHPANRATHTVTRPHQTNPLATSPVFVSPRLAPANGPTPARRWGERLGTRALRSVRQHASDWKSLAVLTGPGPQCREVDRIPAAGTTVVESSKRFDGIETPCLGEASVRDATCLVPCGVRA
jgi:hypothetical protein